MKSGIHWWWSDGYWRNGVHGMMLKIKANIFLIVTKSYRLGPTNVTNRRYPKDILVALADLRVQQVIMNETKENGVLEYEGSKISQISPPHTDTLGQWKSGVYWNQRSPITDTDGLHQGKKYGNASRQTIQSFQQRITIWITSSTITIIVPAPSSAEEKWFLILHLRLAKFPYLNSREARDAMWCVISC